MGKKGKIGAAAGIAAFAAGTYLLYGKDGAKNREAVKGWALKAKGEMLEGIEKLKHVNQETYEKIVDRVEKRYKKFKQVDKKELEKLAKKAKSYWKDISKDLSKKFKAPKAPKTAKKTGRKHGAAKA